MKRILLSIILGLLASASLRSQYQLVGFGSGCPGAQNQIPDIGFTGAVGLGQTIVWQTFRAAPNVPAVLIFGLQQAAIPVGGPCNLLVLPIVVGVTATDTLGIARVPVPVPNDTRLRNTDFLFQYLVVDGSGQAFGGGSMTNGVSLRFL
ncbi:MAG TPA: hypothetical protein PKE00_07890 [Planctomycetota bacterium]|nr:hypothetical protein [Planctomycetota bacterium]